MVRNVGFNKEEFNILKCLNVSVADGRTMRRIFRLHGWAIYLLYNMVVTWLVSEISKHKNSSFLFCLGWTGFAGHKMTMKSGGQKKMTSHSLQG